MWKWLAPLVLISQGAQAAPWADVGNRQLRTDVEISKSAGIIRGPVNSWPLPWAQIDNGINSIGDAPLLPHVAAALARVRALSDRARETSSLEVTATSSSAALPTPSPGCFRKLWSIRRGRWQKSMR